ncbi:MULTISPECIES: hypothetical protein [unclassified Streptomyces]|uniref:hypothetical protein n=1 Tax=unclassified Streptomyces TaxID=2593676 RepID=UPI000DC7592C|nr:MULTISPECIES: hypothetical protein [unclassified Streptomyces]AWZ04666.1 hypothetical protein DRB89_08460 [Streptomyces sp. ICC4]AWZ12279.1 hypothetical protein DRB96_08065 [Streptomyces sp. ICC1]
MNTFLDYLLVLAVAALLLGPALYGALRERRLDRQIRAARRGARTPGTTKRPRPGIRPAKPVAPWAGTLSGKPIGSPRA